MRLKLLIPIVALSCLPGIAEAASPLAAQGNIATIRGVAHIERGAYGTFIEVENPDYSRDVAGFVPFGDTGTFPDLYGLEGRNVEISGILALYGRAFITMTDPNQLRLGGG